MMYAERTKGLKTVDRIMTIGLPNGQHTVNSRMFTAPPEELADWLLSRSPDSEAARLEAPKADQRAIQHSLANIQSLDIGILSQNLNIPCLMVYGQNDPAIESASVQDQSDTLPKHVHQKRLPKSGRQDRVPRHPGILYPWPGLYLGRL